jgi:aminodeoxyfutalosine synthase
MEAMTGLIDTISERAARGEALTEADARALLETPDLIAVSVVADDARRSRHGNRATFGRVLEIHVDAIPAGLPSGAAFGELRIVGTAADIQTAETAVRQVRSMWPSGPVCGFSLVDLAALAAGGPLESACERLARAGLDAIAETPVDRLEDAVAAVLAARRAGLKVLRLTVDALPADRRIAVVAAARDLQAAVGGFRAFAPLPRSISPGQPTTGYDDVKQVALARLMVTGIDSIQVDWPLYGPKLAQVALTVGADDVDGVAAIGDGALGTRRSPIEEIKNNIRAAALEPVERDGLFEPLPAPPPGSAQGVGRV